MARKSQSSFTATKGEAPAVSAPAPAEGMKGQTLRLNLGAWRELKILAIEQGKPAHALLIEAVNDLFKKYGKKALA